jgi:hypothetical protein
VLTILRLTLWRHGHLQALGLAVAKIPQSENIYGRTVTGQCIIIELI